MRLIKKIKIKNNKDKVKKNKYFRSKTKEKEARI